MRVKIETRSDYELYIKKSLADIQMPIKLKDAMYKVVLRAYDDGVAHGMNKLHVEL